ncbi:MAG TPA: tyrosine-type recombinase/integrase [Oligoflexus sp.]|uniref:tyrosine-type recombinase/integrase n=1 Tax=Oligoflexus sp. TaxID=1971216 RepID=UPI002D6D7FEC|nr:tyrosine-type recombinase/integrase [Oligoflexus sp.]HYX34278.1 tyrosine-type recombinase/integrase [Oligoflexus sp.]
MTPLDARLEMSLRAFLHSHGSGLTSREYERTAKEFFAFAFQDIREIGQLTRDHLILYQKWLRTRDQAHKTILKKMSAVSSLCRHLAHEGFIERDLSYDLKRPRSDNRRETADFSDEEVRRLFAALDPKRKSFTSHRALLSIGFYTGLCSAEIRHLKIKNLSDAKGHRVLSLRIKGDKPHEIPLNPFAFRCISEHIERLSELGFDAGHPEQWFFPSLSPIRNSPISSSALEKILKGLVKKSGIKASSVRRYSPHSMRATLAGHLLNVVEAPLDQVQRTLGHASPATTIRYNKREAVTTTKIPSIASNTDPR